MVFTAIRWRVLEPSPRSNGTPLAAIHDARQVNSLAGVDASGEVREREGTPWLSMIGPPNASRRLA